MVLDDFVFGAATSAYQIEGAWDRDGKMPSIWDDISHKGKVLNEQSGDVACDHYHRWQEDLAVIKSLGIGAYRFSISWSRVINGPEDIVWCATKGDKFIDGWEGEKKYNIDRSINHPGLEFYKKLITGLKSIGVEPFVTLYHWDLPSWLNKLGGWGNPECVDEFVRFAELMFKELPEVRYWITFNEPAVFVSNKWGHNDYKEAIRNVLLAHGKTVHLYKEKYDGKIGISLNLMNFVPYDNTDAKDRLAAENHEKMQNRMWLDPIYKGCFPSGINKLSGLKLKFSAEEKKIVKCPMDFLGLNYYTTSRVKYDKSNPPLHSMNIPYRHAERDDMGVQVYPSGLFTLLTKIMEDYGNPDMYITESGCAYADTILHDGSVPDEQRQRYIFWHLWNCNRAIVENGVNLKGYFYWSLLDNFEWMLGYSKRFGLVYVDYPTLERIPKKSYYWYEKIIRDKEFRDKELYYMARMADKPS